MRKKLNQAYCRINSILLFVLIVFSNSCVLSQAQNSFSQEIAREQELVELLTRSTQLMKQADTESLKQAKAILGLAFELDPADPRVLDALGCLALRRGRTDLAENYFHQALEKNMNYDRAYSHLAYIAEEKGDYKLAINLLQTALTLNPMNYQARNNYAVLLLEHSSEPVIKEQAFDELQKAYYITQRSDKIISSNLNKIIQKK